MTLGSLQDRRRNITYVIILAADLSFGLYSVGPVNHQCIMLAAAMLALLEVTKRRVSWHGPAGVIVGVRISTPPIGIITPDGIERGLQAVQHIGFIGRSSQTSLPAGAVVGGHEDERVVELVDPLKCL